MRTDKQRLIVENLRDAAHLLIGASEVWSDHDLEICEKNNIRTAECIEDTAHDLLSFVDKYETATVNGEEDLIAKRKLLFAEIREIDEALEEVRKDRDTHSRR